MNGARLLLDTHAFIWMTLEPQALSRLARAEIIHPHTTKYVSVVSLWEIAIKTGLGKLHFEVPMQQLLDDFDRAGALHRLPIESSHLLRYTRCFRCIIKTHSTECWWLRRWPMTSPSSAER